MIKNLKKTIALFLISVVLISSTANIYYESKNLKEVEASFALPALYTLFSVVLGSCGYFTGSAEGNNALCEAFVDWFDSMESKQESIKDFAWGDAKEQMESLKSMGRGASISISTFTVVIAAMKYFIAKVAPNYVSSARDYTGSGQVSYSGAKPYYYRQDVHKQLMNRINSLNIDFDITKKVNSNFTEERFNNFLSNIQFCAYYLSEDGNKITIVRDSCYGSNNLYNNYIKFYPEGKYFLAIKNNVFYQYQNESSFSSDDKGCEFDYVSITRPSVTSSWRVTGFSHFYNPNSYSYNRYGVFNPCLTDETLLFIETSIPIFNSAQELSDYVTNLDRYKLIEGLYGDSANAYELPTGATVKAGDDAWIDDMSQAIADALAKSETGTLSADDVNAIVSTHVIDYSKQLADINESVGEISGEQVLTNSWLEKIYSKLNEIVVSMSMTDGSSALDDSKAFEWDVIDGGKGQEPDEKDPKIWVPGVTMIAHFLAPLVEFLAEPLSEITKWLKSIRDNIVDGFKQVVDFLQTLPALIFDQFKTILGNIVTSLSTIVTHVAAIAQAVAQFPLDLVEYISAGVKNALDNIKIPLEVPEINIPEIKFPEIPILSDILSCLKAILEAVLQFFKLDLPAIESAIKSNNDEVVDKLPFIPAKNIFNQSISDSYDYPVIKIQTPDIIKQFTKSDYIILFNGADFASYFKFVRGLLVAFVWVTYAYIIVCKFRIRFGMEA